MCRQAAAGPLCGLRFPGWAPSLTGAQGATCPHLFSAGHPGMWPQSAPALPVSERCLGGWRLPPCFPFWDQWRALRWGRAGRSAGCEKALSSERGEGCGSLPEETGGPRPRWFERPDAGSLPSSRRYCSCANGSNLSKCPVFCGMNRASIPSDRAGLVAPSPGRRPEERRGGPAQSPSSRVWTGD